MVDPTRGVEVTGRTVAADLPPTPHLLSRVRYGTPDAHIEGRVHSRVPLDTAGTLITTAIKRFNYTSRTRSGVQWYPPGPILTPQTTELGLCSRSGTNSRLPVCKTNAAGPSVFATTSAVVPPLSFLAPRERNKKQAARGPCTILFLAFTHFLRCQPVAFLSLFFSARRDVVFF